MSIKFPVPSRLAALLIAASMIGCGGTESNRAGTSERAEGPAPVVEPAGEPSVAEGVREGQPSTAAPGTVLFIGTSLTAGLGLPEAESFPLLLERRIESAGLPFRVVNAGVSGETSAGALRRVDWLLRQDFDIAVVETGANDMLRGIDPAATEQNIQQIVDRLRAGNPDVVIVLAGMLALPNMGQAYAQAFESIYPRLAERNGLPFVPFLLDGVGGERDLNQSDGVHPNAEGHRIIADTVWRVLEPVLVEAARERAERAAEADRDR
jgi:acyl-CoA thioesterase I